MKPNIINALVAMEAFFTYNVTPNELVDVLNRVNASNERDTAIINSLVDALIKKA